MIFLADNKILCRAVTVELVDSQYLRCTVHNHVRILKFDEGLDVIEAYKTLCKGKKYPLIFVAPNVDKIEEKTREVIEKMSEDFFSLQALVMGNYFTNFIFELYLKMSKQIVPTKLFTSEEKAKDWIKKNI